MEENKKRYCSAAMIVIGYLLASCAWADSEADIEEGRRLREAKMIANTKESFVVVHYHHKRSERARPADEDYSYGYDNEADEVLYKILAKRTTDAVGVIIGEAGEVFTRDAYLDPDVVDKITITGQDGKSAVAEWDRVLTSMAGCILRIREGLPVGWKPLTFPPKPLVLSVDTRLFDISLGISSEFGGGVSEDQERSCYIVGQAAPARNWESESDVPDYLRIGGNGEATVVCDANGVALGVTAHDRIEVGPSGMSWQGRDILGDAGVKRGDLERTIREQFSKCLYQAKITFREPPQEDDEYDMGGHGSYYSGPYGIGEDAKELIVFALAIALDKLLLPAALAQGQAAGIDSISVDAGDEQLEGFFEGTLKHYEGTVVRISKPVLKDVAKIDKEVTLARIEPFWTVFGRELAGKDLVIGYNRWILKRRGYADRLYRQVENDIRSGSWLLDREGRLAGLCVGARREYERILPYLMGEDSAYSYSPRLSSGRTVRVFSGRSCCYADESETELVGTDVLASIVSDLGANYDPHIRHLSKEEQKRRVWLGVEFTGVSKDMAKQLNLRRETQDGRIGLIVNRVYPGSPAAKMKLVEGDVLLKLKVAEGPWPIELVYERDEDYEGPDFENVDIPEEYEAMGYQMPRKRPWVSRDNSLTRMLYAIGAGVRTTVTYVHEGKELEQEFVIEQAPCDSLSANKLKDEKLGITVKDLTYEVRAALKLSDAEKGILVSEVEPDTPAALARINAFELIRAADGRTVGSVEELESAIKGAQEEGKESIRLTVEWMGKTRLADLKYEAKGPSLKDMIRVMPRMPRGNGQEEF